MSGSSNSSRYNAKDKLDISNNSRAIGNTQQAINNELLASKNTTNQMANITLALQNNTVAAGVAMHAAQKNTEQIERMREAAISGYAVFETKASMQSVVRTSEESGMSFKVVNDGEKENNGFYFWDGSSYVKELSLVAGVIDKNNTAEPVSGSAVFDALQTKPDLIPGKNLFDGAACERGYLRSDDGGFVVDEDSLVSGYIEIAGGQHYCISGRATTVTKAVAFYDSEKQVIAPTVGNHESGDLNGAYLAPAAARFMRLTVVFNGGGSAQSVQVEKGVVATAYQRFSLLIEPAKTRATVENSDFIGRSVNLFDHKTMVVYNKFVSNSNGAAVSENGWAHVVVPIPSTMDDYFSIKNDLTDVPQSSAVVHFFDVQGNRVGVLTGTKGAIPGGAVLVKFNIAQTLVAWEITKKTLHVSYGNGVGEYVAFGKQHRMLPAYAPPKDNLSGKVITWVGDSIVKAEGYKGWVTLANERTGAANINRGDNGATIADIYPSAGCMSGALLTYQYNMNTDATVFLGGTNDFGKSLPIGTDIEMLSEVAGTVKGSLYKAIAWVKSNNPNSKILVSTPLERSTDAVNARGLKLSDYRDAIIDVCIAHDVPYVDSYNVNLISMPTAYKYLYDGLHPNDAGYLVSYDKIEAAIVSLFE